MPPFDDTPATPATLPRMPLMDATSRGGRDDSPTHTLPLQAGASIRDAARWCLLQSDPAAKVAATRVVAQAFSDGVLLPSPPLMPVGDTAEAGRPERPHLVPPRKLPQRGLGTDEGRAAFAHAIAHIEFNAINLAWDAVWRFDGMPEAFYADWVRVADDEARHFGLLDTRLQQFGFRYGDFDAHDGLWDMARRTAHSCLERMALVPRVLEARGLDVTPAMIDRLTAIGDMDTVAILDVILREEVAHVAAGSHWFRWCCEREGVDPASTFDALVAAHARGSVRKPFNLAARAAAGFDGVEMQALDRLAGAGA